MKETQIKVNVNFRILPFGHASIEIKGHEEEKEVKGKQCPVYLEPKTTTPEVIEITFDGENYSVPKTTGGFL
jgi:hypothetical protein